MMDLFTEPVLRFAALVIVFGVVVTGVLILGGLWRQRQTVRGRLLPDATAAAVGKSVGPSLRSHETSRLWSALAERIEKTGLSLVDTKSDKVRAKLAAAGFDSPVAPKIFTLVRIVLVLALPAMFFALSTLRADQPSIFRLYILSMGLALLGLYLPNLFVTAKADRRREEIVNGFPDALDLMLVCVESGLGLEAAFDRVGREMVRSHPLVARMISMVTLELRAGATREEALRNMAARVEVDEIRSFATLLIQSSKLGSSIGATLRVYAEEMREKRRMRAEEKAHRLPVLLSIPLVACMLPVMIGVLMLPAAIRVVRTLIPAMGGG